MWFLVLFWFHHIEISSVNTLNDFVIQIKNVYMIKKKIGKKKFLDDTLFLHVVPGVFLFHCIEIVSISSQVPFPWFGNLNWK